MTNTYCAVNYESLDRVSQNKVTWSKIHWQQGNKRKLTWEHGNKAVFLSLGNQGTPNLRIKKKKKTFREEGEEKRDFVGNESTRTPPLGGLGGP